MLSFGTSLRSRTAEWVSIKDLQENMVVVQPVLNNNGLTLVAAGSRLTVSGIEKLGRFMAGETLVQIVRV